eukprot:CAMPEP_0173287412 /NCGR_PEP_ID=MMETSP1143-20121109/9774_1 /TAXON_ID=483371 /ORGANISM="non described non described, Strain CCMP2298" /LENGTH=108 /DNA_ID=CAMNT_0014225917 /DNA_START=304 /DNA_END=626 /DNA_ORIENTATION=-
MESDSCCVPCACACVFVCVSSTVVFIRPSKTAAFWRGRKAKAAPRRSPWAVAASGCSPECSAKEDVMRMKTPTAIPTSSEASVLKRMSAEELEELVLVTAGLFSEGNL